ncbi:hypothetical protein JKF63_03663 [Porcisia hertigi]|uniref:EGF-like domain-containing protein n=1 Tax=Porcisia hertigi TaxID=2761500 RepID=A0A836IH66_9TRYP|nr:hypothetical protein JKF63_03663 [Porcisia hertigi]
MRIFSSKQKVYTTDSAPIDTSEDVGVEGKRYPTSLLGRLIVRYPALMLLTFSLPLAFFVIGCMRINSKMSYSLDDYQLRSSTDIRQSALKVKGVQDDWAVALSGSDWLAQSVNLTHPRAVIQDTVELRAMINLTALSDYAQAMGWSPEKRDTHSNMLHPSILDVYRSTEKRITQLEGYESVCFTNDLRNNEATKLYPTCAPVSSITQYTYPTWTGSEWIMDGAGSVHQLNYMQRLFANPSYGWFLDRNFSTLHQKSLHMRSQYTFASSRGESKSAYRARMKKFLPHAIDLVNTGGDDALPFVHFHFGGGSLQDILMEIAGEKEGYKVGVAALICFLLSWWHCRTFVVGLYTAAESVFAYMAAVGLYALIYGDLPLTTYSAIIWVMTFCMHGTLSFYDMFVYSGIMATKGRQNNLSVAQRLCFTMRRTVVGVWIADVLAIIIFAINTTSLFRSVEQFSVFMMIALLWNMYCVAVPTPALIVLHHLHFSNRRRNAQKQNDALNGELLRCQRSGHFVHVLEAVQDNIAEDEYAYSMNDDLVQKLISKSNGINTRGSSPIHFLRCQVRQGCEKLRAARKDFVEGLCRKRSEKNQVPSSSRKGGEGAGEYKLALQDFLEVGGVHPLEGGAGVGANGLPLYYNPRMVFPSDLIHIPAVYVERSEKCWGSMCDALGLRSRNSHGEVIPPRVLSLKSQGTTAGEVNAFADRWREVGTRMGLETTSSSRSAGLVPLAVRNAVRAQDPAMVVDPFIGAGSGKKNVDALAPDAAGASRRVTGGPSGLGLGKLRHRWAHRVDAPRTMCCGLFGPLANETPEQRMRRLMSREVKREGYSLFQRFLFRYYLPAIYFLRYALLALLLALFVTVCVLGSRVTSSGLPITLMVGQHNTVESFSAMSDTFSQRGDCTFCGPYYRSLHDYRSATSADVLACSPEHGTQMNLYSDSCGVCNGTNACADCAGTPKGEAVPDDCGGCTVPGSAESAKCTCPASRDCQYCEWALGQENVGGMSCTTACDASKCANKGKCNQYTGACDCNAGFTGDTCKACESWLLPIESNPDCTLECNAWMGSEDCNCDLSTGRCRSCPAGTRGYDCSKPALDCGAHGKFDRASGKCVCRNWWKGEFCNVSQACHGRGVLLPNSESPTGFRMCACVGHWRGNTCEVCDCRNGGMCNAVTGECECVGAFTGPRCETCTAGCTLHGTCPDVSTPDYSLWNIRTCISDACSEADVKEERMCTACRPKTLPLDAACNARTKKACMANPDCWWYEKWGKPARCGRARQSNDFTAMNCACNNPNVWSGAMCDTCNPPPGAKCLDEGSVLGCNGLLYTSVASVVGIDVCGACGGDGLCRGCDGVPGSGATYDLCGVCGGDNTCTSATAATPMYVEYLFDLTGVNQILNNAAWCDVVSSIATQIRLSDGAGSQTRTVLEDFLGDSEKEVTSLSDFYNFAKENGRLSEAVFRVNYANKPLQLLHIVYRVESKRANSHSTPTEVMDAYNWISEALIIPFKSLAQSNGIGLHYTSTFFQPALSKVGALQSLWFMVGIGLAVTFVFLLVYYVSLTTAVTATLVAAIACFGSLTACTIFHWEADAVLQVCISCTVPISVEYIVHFCSGYFDYLQTTTSHLFAREVKRWNAVQGALLRTAPAVCTSAMCVIFVSIMFAISSLMPSRRTAQISITLHLLVLLAGVLFTGAVAALGPRKTYRHWTISVALCGVCAFLAGLAVVIIFSLNGVLGPHGKKILTH